MKTAILALLFCFTCLLALSQNTIIPEPVSMQINRGHYDLPAEIFIQTGENPEVKQIALDLGKQLTNATGFKAILNGTNSDNAIRLLLNTTTDQLLGNEGYSLTITSTSVEIKANKPAGLFYGVKTLFQLFPNEIESKSVVKNIKWQLPCVAITDYPRFGWRGLMFDISRHFFTKQEIKDFVDQMSKYKFNLLHLHLTDDEGWRVEIKSLPKLTEIGAWNVHRVGTFGNFSAPAPEEPRNYGGYLTQADIKELIDYAKGKYVNILPEIDVPGHSLAAIASYPDLSCTPGSEKYQVRSGERIMDWHDHGFTALVDNTLCPANEKVYVFLDKVFSELALLFPFEYIHVGAMNALKISGRRAPRSSNLCKSKA
jgi:hexosaminidase